MAATFGLAFAKAQMGAGTSIPRGGCAFLSVNDNDKQNLLPIARGLSGLGFKLVATRGTADHLRSAGVACGDVYKVLEGRPNIVDLMKNGEVDLIVNTPLGKDSYYDEKRMRVVATQRGVPLVTTLSGGHAMVEAIQAMRDQPLEVSCLQETYPIR